MKTFVYKTLLIFVFLFVFFQLTIGAKIRQLNSELQEFKSKKNIENIKNKIRGELKNAVKKEKYLSPADAKLINDFINKLKKELSNTN
jgi:carbon monoxide dehydrogenase subunit G